MIASTDQPKDIVTAVIPLRQRLPALPATVSTPRTLSQTQQIRAVNRQSRQCLCLLRALLPIRTRLAVTHLAAASTVQLVLGLLHHATDLNLRTTAALVPAIAESHANVL